MFQLQLAKLCGKIICYGNILRFEWYSLMRKLASSLLKKGNYKVRIIKSVMAKTTISELLKLIRGIQKSEKCLC